MDKRGQVISDEAEEVGSGQAVQPHGHGKEFGFYFWCSGKSMEGFKPEREREGENWICFKENTVVVERLKAS